MAGLAFAGLLAWGLLLGAAQAQGLSQGEPVDGPDAAPEGILILNQDRFFSDSQYGQRVQAELEAAGLALATENREIEARLTEVELQLTEDRQSLERDEFMVRAAEFDQQVETIRATQDAKTRALNAAAEAAQRRFFNLAVPILLEVVAERRAAVILDSRTVLLAADTVDITDTAIARVDAELGDGGEAALIDLQSAVEEVPPQLVDPADGLSENGPGDSGLEESGLEESGTEP